MEHFFGIAVRYLQQVACQGDDKSREQGRTGLSCKSIAEALGPDLCQHESITAPPPAADSSALLTPQCQELSFPSQVLKASRDEGFSQVIREAVVSEETGQLKCTGGGRVVRRANSVVSPCGCKTIVTRWCKTIESAHCSP
jgi:hypothetical protein